MPEAGAPGGHSEEHSPFEKRQKECGDAETEKIKEKQRRADADFLHEADIGLDDFLYHYSLIMRVKMSFEGS
ncbi:MAG: hypothetical protein ACYC5N_04155 [Endomicrobiales bacterium]